MTDPRVDRYIADAPDFAKPILSHLRNVVHDGCPDVEEAIKWSRPAFIYHGKLLGLMSAFSEHCSFGFWLAEVNRELAASGVLAESASGSLGRVTTLKDLPRKKDLLRYVREAAALLDDPERTTPRMRKAAQREKAEMPLDFQAALKTNKSAADAFAEFAPCQQREYVEWIADAKRDATRQKRITTALEWLAEGKPRHWKYMRRGGERVPG